MNTFAIPDIHGRLDLLNKILVELKSKMDLKVDRLIFMGDMIDRGPDSKGVVDKIMELQETYGKDHVIALRGNHEDFLVNAMRKGRRDDFDIWLYNGGGQTLRSFTGTDGLHSSGVDKKYVDWIENLPLFFETDTHFFSHAPCPKEKDRPIYLQGQPFAVFELNWTYFHDEKGKSRHHEKNGKPQIGVCGHIHALMQAVYAPRLYEHYLFLDAGCGCSLKAPLIACNVDTREVLWAWPDGQEPIIPKNRPYIPVPPLAKSP